MMVLPIHLSQTRALVQLGPTALSQGIPRGWKNRKYSSWLGLPTMLFATNKFVARAANNSGEEGLEKRKGEIYFMCQQLGER